MSKENEIRDTDWLTSEEAAAYLKVMRRSLLLWTRQGKIKGHVLTGTKRRTWRFRKADLDAALLSKSVVGCEPLPVRSENWRTQ
jgi:excisionase family DNA binding protein